MGDHDQNAAGGGDGGDPVTIVYESQLSPEIRADKTIREAIKDSPKLNDLVRNHATLKARLARSVVIPNAEKPDPEEVKVFRSAMGLPDKADDYPIDTAAFKDMPAIDQVVAMCKTRAAEMALTKPQGQRLFDTIMGLSKAGRDQQEKARAEAISTRDPKLAEAMGGDAEKAKGAVNLMTAFLINHIGSERLIKNMSDSLLLYDPEAIMKFADLAVLLGEEPYAGDGGKGPAGKPAPEGQATYSAEFKGTYGERKKKK